MVSHCLATDTLHLNVKWLDNAHTYKLCVSYVRKDKQQKFVLLQHAQNKNSIQQAKKKKRRKFGMRFTAAIEEEQEKNLYKSYQSTKDCTHLHLKMNEQKRSWKSRVLLVRKTESIKHCQNIQTLLNGKLFLRISRFNFCQTCQQHTFIKREKEKLRDICSIIPTFSSLMASLENVSRAIVCTHVVLQTANN